MVQDKQADIRVWKLFGLVTLMLMHRPRGTGAVEAKCVLELTNSQGTLEQVRVTMLCGTVHIRRAPGASAARESGARKFI